ncbi:MAG: aspartate aminotransferase family protein [Candidatus Aenigmatarchaeota archaeon]|nr:MAG: aspartate aminotransferase family protein [Candidatus Aenigmarchaeota archaeon]
MVLPVRARKLDFDRSYALYQRALEHIPFGVSSNARLWRTVCPTYMPCSIFIDHARGSHIWDVDNNEYVDYRLGYGPVILGHAYKPVNDAVMKASLRGEVYALANELEITLAELMCKLVPCAEQVRFANSGTEATMTAIRIARAFTKKDKILKFEGHYHGAHDYVLFSTDTPFEKLQPTAQPIEASDGIPSSIRELVLVERWNDFVGVETAVREHHKELAAIILEPIMGNAAVIPPAAGFLKHLRELCDKYNIVLIFDEVKTGFRITHGGAQQLFKVTPDLATYSKSLGNGYPVAAIAGKADTMGVVGPMKVAHGGTYSANPISLTAAITTLNILRKHPVHDRIKAYGSKLMKGIGRVFKDRDISCEVQGFPQMFQFMFTDESVTEYRDLQRVDQELYARFHYELLRRGVMVDEDNEEPMFVCYSHAPADLKHTLWAVEDAIEDATVPRTSIV